MGLFKHKEKAKLDVPSTTAPSTASSSNPPRNSNQSSTDQSYHDSAYYSNSNASTADSRPKEQPPIQNHQNQGQAPGTTVTTTTTTTTSKLNMSSPPKKDLAKISVIATTTVAPDGTTHTSSHPYNPHTDPPTQSTEMTMNNTSQNALSKQSHSGTHTPNPVQGQNNQPSQPQSYPQNLSPPNAQTQPHAGLSSPLLQQTHQQYSPTMARVASPNRNEGTSQPQSFGLPPTTNQTAYPQAKYSPEGAPPPVPRKDQTEAGRAIPQRSEMRNGSKYEMEDTSPTQAQSYPDRSENYNSPTRQSFVPTDTTSPNQGYDSRLAGHGQHQGYPPHVGRGHTGYQDNDPEMEIVTPLSPTPARAQSQPYANTNASNISSTTGAHPSPSTSSHYTHLASQPSTSTKPNRTSIGGAIRGIRGASEALRGTVNQGIAKGVHNKEEEARMRAVRHQGMEEFRESGLREGFRQKAGERQRKRSRDYGHNGIYGSEGPGGLDPVEERSVRSLESR